MKVKGVLEIEGVIWQIDVEHPDEEKVIYVTNLSPESLVIPWERFNLRYLGVSNKTLDECAEKGIIRLSQLIDKDWQIKKNSLSFKAVQELKEALRAFQEIAFLFNPSSFEGLVEEENGLFLKEIIKEEGLKEKELRTSPSPSLESLIRDLGFSLNFVQAMENKHRVKNLKELLSLGRTRAFMTLEVAKKDFQEVEEKLNQWGYSFKKEEK